MASENKIALKYKYLGWSGLRVSELALGPFRSVIGGLGDLATQAKIIDRYVEAGGNFIDLSDAYTGSEKAFGEYLKGKDRDSFVISTKVGFPVGKNPNDCGQGRKHVMAAIERSLKDIGTDYVDVYYAHVWDPNTTVEETLRTWNDLLRSGKVRYVAASNFSGWQLQKVVDYAKFMGIEKVVCLQQQYNLIDRHPELDEFVVADNEHLGILAWGPLSAGWLSGKYHRGMTDPPSDTRVALETKGGLDVNSIKVKGTERTWKILDTLSGISKKLNKTPSQIAVNWITPRAIPILGPRSVEQLNDGLGAAGWSLSKEDRDALNEASALPTIMPYSFQEFFNKGRSRDGPTTY